MAIAFGAFIAIGTWPVRDALVRTGLRPGYSALVLLVVLVLALVVPLLVMAPGLAEQIGGLVGHARRVLGNLSPEAPACGGGRGLRQ